MTATYTEEAVARAAGVAERLRRGMRAGVLSFPLSAFDADDRLDVESFRAHVRSQLAAGPGALFPCCGTGEFFSLAEDEYEALVRATVEEAGGAVPVVAGAGYGWAQAARFTAAAARAGADAVLLLPPYLVEAPQPGLVEHVRQVAARSPLPLIVYQRAQARFTPAAVAELARLPSVIGLKDGLADLDRLQRLRLAAPAGWLWFNGTATAELQVRAYQALGVPAYSSAVHAFAPEIARDFFTALHAGDQARVDRLLNAFYVPFVELRDRGEGYAVALVKAAARLRGAPVGPVRAPLADPSPEHVAELEGLLMTGLDLVGAAR